MLCYRRIELLVSVRHHKNLNMGHGIQPSGLILVPTCSIELTLGGIAISITYVKATADQCARLSGKCFLCRYRRHVSALLITATDREKHART